MELRPAQYFDFGGIARKSTQQKLSFFYATLLLDLLSVPTKNYFKLYGNYDLSKILASGEMLLHATCLLILIYASTEYSQNISNH